ncbi:MAG: spore germination protein, partial [Bacilli bacterium]|nr:spore germination protein [Bacilli bacterium]
MKANSSHIVYYLTRNLFLGFGFSLLFDKSTKDSYIGILLGMALGLLFMYGYSYIIKLKGKKTLKEIFKNQQTLGLITRIILLIVSVIILTYVLVIYKIFIVSFLLVSSPELFITIPFIILATMAAFKGIKGITRLSSSLVVVSIVFSVLIGACLFCLVETTNLLPILTTPPMGILETTLTYAGISTFPNILILHITDNSKGIIKTYVLASILLFLAAICINGVLGEALVNIFRFPEYMVLKQIKLFNFIEKMENVLSIIWIIDLFITGSMAIYSIKEMMPQKNNKACTIISLVIL